MSKKGKGKSHKSGEKVRVAFRRNRAKPARDKDWLRQMREGGEDAIEPASSENVVAKGQLSRKRTIIQQDDDSSPGNRPSGLGSSDSATEQSSAETPLGESIRDRASGVVIAMRGLIAEVDDGNRIWPCTIRRILRTRRIHERNAVTVGDRVRFSIASDEEGVRSEGVIESVEPRRGILARVAGRKTQTIVANVDQAIIVASAGVPAFKPHLIDRYIVAAHAGEIIPIVCLNKVDRDEDGQARAGLTFYEAMGYSTLLTCAVTGMGIDRLKAVLAGKCSVIAGQSGVGKSSLLNAIDPALKLRVGEVNEDLGKGRHITTTASLIRLKVGGYVVDTPGIRSFDVSVVPVNEIEMHFVDFAPYIPNCKFADCTHTHESDCAVKSAVLAGKITEARYDSYCRMIEERAREGQRTKEPKA